MENIQKAAEAMNAEATQNEGQENFESTAVETREKAEIEISSIENHRAGLYLAERHLPKERVEDISAELATIDEIENTKTIEMRRELETLPKDFQKVEFSLIAQGVNPGLLTVDEAIKMNEYATNANEDVVKQKTEVISGAITRIRNGARNRRDYYWDSEKAARLERLVEKQMRYEEGDIDIECGFDKEYYLEEANGSPREDNSHIFDDARARAMFDSEKIEGGAKDSDYQRFLRDMGVQSSLEEKFEYMTMEELLEEELISEDDIFIYGPYTPRDLREDYEMFRASTWVDASNWRDKTAISDILQETVSRRDDTESDLLREFVAREVLPSRRPSVKNMLSMLASLGIEYADKSADEIKEKIGEEKADKLKDNLTSGAYYAAKVLNMKAEDLKETYGAARPVTKEFFEEVLKRSEAMTEHEAESNEKYEAPYLTRLNGRLFAAEALYEPILAEESDDGGEEFEGLALPGGMLGAAAGNLIGIEESEQ